MFKGYFWLLKDCHILIPFFFCLIFICGLDVYYLRTVSHITLGKKHKVGLLFQSCLLSTRLMCIMMQLKTAAVISHSLCIPTCLVVVLMQIGLNNCFAANTENVYITYRVNHVTASKAVNSHQLFQVQKKKMKIILFLFHKFHLYQLIFIWS